MIRRLFVLILASVMIVNLYGCTKVNMQPQTPKEWRAYIRYRRDQVLHELYKEAPQARWEIARAKGYAIFVNLNVNLILASFSGGRGLVHERGECCDQGRASAPADSYFSRLEAVPPHLGVDI